MAKYVNKTWVDRVSEQPQRRLLTPTDGSTSMTVDVTRQEGIVIQEGDAFSANNMNDLEQRIKTAVDANDSAITSVTQKANTNQQNISTLSGTVTTLNSKVTTIEGELTANGTRIYMDYKNGKYGYNTSASRGADTFYPFKGPVQITWYTNVNLGDMSDGHRYRWTLPVEASVLSIWVHAHGWQRIEMQISAGTTVYANTDYYGGGAAALFTNVPAGAVVTFIGDGGEENNISATIYKSVD